MLTVCTKICFYCTAVCICLLSEPIMCRSCIYAIGRFQRQQQMMMIIIINLAMSLPRSASDGMLKVAPLLFQSQKMTDLSTVLLGTQLWFIQISAHQQLGKEIGSPLTLNVSFFTPCIQSSPKVIELIIRSTTTYIIFTAIP